MADMPGSTSGSLIILAWPETFVRMVPRWYSAPLKLFGLVKNDHIRAGHAAAILVDNISGQCRYTDFGRYMSPTGFGRTRTHLTDPELILKTIADIDQSGAISNLSEILGELDRVPHHTHGAGLMYVSVRSGIFLDIANSFINGMNRTGSMPYDPFRKGATNCSRYIYDLIITACPDERLASFRRRSLPAAAPLSNVFWGGNTKPAVFTNGKLRPVSGSRTLTVLKNFLGQPEPATKRQTINSMPDDVKTLTGTGSDGWFQIAEGGANKLLITRLDDAGSQVFKKQYEPEAEALNVKEPFEVAYDTHALSAVFIQHGKQLHYRAL